VAGSRWALHGLCGVWGGIAAGIFGLEALGGLGWVSLMSQTIGTLAGVIVAFVGGGIVYGAIKAVMGLRLTDEQEHMGADPAVRKITALPDYNRGEV
jgi:Amt family ammonium transporter